MNRFRETFSNRVAVLPVIHVTSTEQALRNVRVAVDAGADGVWLISHGRVSHGGLMLIHAACRSNFPTTWIGINFLDLPVVTAMSAISADPFRDTIGGLWTDNARIDEELDVRDQVVPREVLTQRDKWNGLYFGGVAFKGQRTVADLETASKIAAKYMDVITTSGPATGQAPDVEKLRRLRAGAGAHPLAVASGVCLGNVRSFLPYVDAIMVASGISRRWDRLDPAMTRELVDEVRAWEAEVKPLIVAMMQAPILDEWADE